MRYRWAPHELSGFAGPVSVFWLLPLSPKQLPDSKLSIFRALISSRSSPAASQHGPLGDGQMWHDAPAAAYFAQSLVKVKFRQGDGPRDFCGWIPSVCRKCVNRIKMLLTKSGIRISAFRGGSHMNKPLATLVTKSRAWSLWVISVKFFSFAVKLASNVKWS